MLETKNIDYTDNGVALEGTLVTPNNSKGKLPAVLVVHDWSGKNSFATEKAALLAQLGYAGFAIDMYGKGKLGTTNDEKLALMQPLMQDRQALRQRIIASLTIAQQQPQIDADNIAVIGFCFGGLCALDLARSGVNIKGAVSFHGLLGAPDIQSAPKISAKVLALHGYNDPMGTPDQVMTFCDEMTAAQADWQVHMYGNTTHAFMNPLANDPAAGLAYQPQTAARAWRLMEDFLAEIFTR
jgi:dienelactone hydrolase